jgi:zinc D-Ala-D-Ala carboxypeptidase
MFLCMITVIEMLNLYSNTIIRATYCAHGTIQSIMAHSKLFSVILYVLCALVCLFATSTVYFGYKTATFSKTITQLSTTLNQETSAKNTFIDSTTNALSELERASTTIAILSSKLSLTIDELDELEDNYRKEKKKNDGFEDQIKEMSGTVSDLDKLAKTDEELLQKYSKVYFLNEHYIPEALTSIKPEFLYTEEKQKQIHKKVEPYLTEMLEDALQDGVKIWVSSAYRSFYEQASLKGAYTQTYGNGANTFSADQGYSEHQLGTTLDFTTEGIGGGLEGFQNTPAYTWLQNNAHKYGFTLSYPKDNAYYIFEPWHWRFVGEDLADDLHDKGIFFYDMDQRDIDAYLIKIFD